MAGPSFVGCLLTMIWPSACTRRRAAIDLAGSGGGVCHSARADDPGALALGREADPDDSSLPPDPQRLEVIAYTDHRSYTDPVGELRRLQRAIAAARPTRRPRRTSLPRWA